MNRRIAYQLLISTALAASIAVVPPCAAADLPATAFTHAVVIDGTGREAIEDATVIIQGEAIVAVGPASEVAIPHASRKIDLSGKSLLPGLADMHVHLLGGWDGVAVDMLGYRRYLNALLYAGVTTVLDTGNVQPYITQMRDEIAAGRLAGPRIYCVGAIVDGADPVWPPITHVVSSDTEIPGIVKRLKADRVDFIKAYVGLSHPQLRTLVTEGRKVSLRVLVDQWKLNGSLDIVDDGVYGFAHMPTFALGDRSLDVFKENGTAVITTLAVYEFTARRRLKNLDFIHSPLIADTFPALFLDGLRTEAARTLSPEEQADMPRLEGRVPIAMRNAKALFDKGVLVVAGTDAPYPGVFQGESLHRELELLVEGGLSPVQAIAVASGNAAKLLADESWGVVAPGRRADLIIVDGRPDRHIAASRNIVNVVQGGRILDRRRLKLNPADDPGFRTSGPIE